MLADTRGPFAWSVIKSPVTQMKDLFIVTTKRDDGKLSCPRETALQSSKFVRIFIVRINGHVRDREKKV